MRQVQEKEPKMSTILAIRVDNVIHPFCECAMDVLWMAWWLALEISYRALLDCSGGELRVQMGR
jgi:hypothetical protein